MTTKHTPGPWKVETRNAGNIGDRNRITIRALDGLVAHVKRVAVPAQEAGIGNPAVERGLSEVKANAILIATAPDLLAACKMVINTPGCNLVNHVFNAVTIAIAKAEGK